MSLAPPSLPQAAAGVRAKEAETAAAKAAAMVPAKGAQMRALVIQLEAKGRDPQPRRWAL